MTRGQLVRDGLGHAGRGHPADAAVPCETADRRAGAGAQRGRRPRPGDRVAAERRPGRSMRSWSSRTTRTDGTTAVARTVPDHGGRDAAQRAQEGRRAELGVAQVLRRTLTSWCVSTTTPGCRLGGGALGRELEDTRDRRQLQPAGDDGQRPAVPDPAGRVRRVRDAEPAPRLVPGHLRDRLHVPQRGAARGEPDSRSRMARGPTRAWSRTTT